MPQQSELCDESAGSWLPLVEYSVRSGLSLSTIRRKIKSNSIPFRLENGRYLIFFEETVAPTPKPAPVMRREETRVVAPPPPPIVRDLPRKKEERTSTPSTDESVRMVSEAFEHAIREKDERIILLERANRELEDRLNELRLLVKVLEEKYEVRY
jgi:hypothetical protein